MSGIKTVLHFEVEEQVKKYIGSHIIAQSCIELSLPCIVSIVMILEVHGPRVKIIRLNNWQRIYKFVLCAFEFHLQTCIPA